MNITPKLEIRDELGSAGEATLRVKHGHFHIDTPIGEEDAARMVKHLADLFERNLSQAEPQPDDGLPEWFCSREGWQTQSVVCEHYGAAGSICNKTAHCNHQVPF